MKTTLKLHKAYNQFAKAQHVIRIALDVIEDMLRGSNIALEMRGGWIAKIRIAMNMKQAELSSPGQTLEDFHDWLETYENRRALGRKRIDLIEEAVRLIEKHLEIMEKALRGTDFEMAAHGGWLGQIREALNMEHFPLTNNSYTFRDMASQIWEA